MKKKEKKNAELWDLKTQEFKNWKSEALNKNKKSSKAFVLITYLNKIVTAIFIILANNPRAGPYFLNIPQNKKVYVQSIKKKAFINKQTIIYLKCFYLLI